MAEPSKKTAGFLAELGKLATMTVEKKRQSSHTFTGSIPGDVAIAVENALTSLKVENEETSTTESSPFGPMERPFHRYRVTDPNTGEEITIPWGTWLVKGLGEVTISLDPHHVAAGQIVCSFEKNSETSNKLWTDLIKQVEVEIPKRSVFKGRAVKMDGPGDTVVPSFLDLRNEVKLFLNADIEAQLEETLFLPIENREEYAKAGISMRRGCIFEGQYGTGKSLLAYILAQRGVRAKWTYLRTRSNLASLGMIFASSLQPCIVFIEDIDAAAHGSRDHLNNLLNTVSSIDNKHATEVMLTLSTNFIDRIDPAMLRPGRVNSIVNLAPPNRDTVARIILEFGGKWLDESEAMGTFNAACEQMAGTTPAILCEVIDRCKIRAMSLKGRFNSADMMRVFNTMARQRELAIPKFVEDDTATTLANSLQTVVKYGAD